MRPYEGRSTNDAEFSDNAYAVTHVVYTLNDYGCYALSPQWLPWEYQFLRENLPVAIAKNDPDMTGEFMDTLRAFDVDDDDPQVRRGFEFLLESQQADGSWGSWDANSLYTGFHATWAAVDGLREFRRRGRGISFPALLPLLARWARIAY